MQPNALYAERCSSKLDTQAELGNSQQKRFGQKDDNDVIRCERLSTPLPAPQ